MTDITVRVRLPKVPNFLRLEESDKACIPVQDLTDDELRSVGEAWTKALIENAQNKRNQPHD